MKKKKPEILLKDEFILQRTENVYFYFQSSENVSTLQISQYFPFFCCCVNLKGKKADILSISQEAEILRYEDFLAKATSEVNRISVLLNTSFSAFFRSDSFSSSRLAYYK